MIIYNKSININCDKLTYNIKKINLIHTRVQLKVNQFADTVDYESILNEQKEEMESEYNEIRKYFDSCYDENNDYYD